MTESNDNSQCEVFSNQAQLRLQERIGAISGSHSRVFLAERHGDLTPLQALAQPETLRAMFCANHTKIGAELFHVGQNPIFEAYFRHEISDDNLQNYILNTPTNYEEDLRIDDQPTLRLFFEVIKNAREQGIQFYGLGTLAGLADQETIIPKLEKSGAIDLQVMQKLEAIPNFFKASQAIQQNVITAIAKTMALDNEKTESLLVKFAGKEPPEIGALLEGDQAFLDRLGKDPSKADLINNIAGDTGITVIYGALHLWRIKGDIDNSIGESNSAVITMLEDTKTFWQEWLPALRQNMQELGIDTNLENLGDYQFDAKTSTWYDGKNDTNTVIDVPEGMKPASLNAPLATPEPSNDILIDF